MKTPLTYLLKLKYEYRSVVASEPRLSWLHRPVIWWEQYKIWCYYRQHGAGIKDCVVDAQPEFVLDGFQGSANSFAAAAFEHTSPSPCGWLTTCMRPRRSSRRSVEGCRRSSLFGRPPGPCHRSSAGGPNVSVQQATRGYVRFYEKLEPYTGGFVLSPFEQTTTRLGDVIRKVNRRFGTSFDTFEHTEANMRAMRGHMDDLADAEGTIPEEEAYDRRKRQTKCQLERSIDDDMLVRAEAVHRRLIVKADYT